MACGELINATLAVLPLKQRGLTLPELLAAMAIMAILATIAVPNFRETIRQNRLTGQINEFVQALRLTQSEAIKRGKTVTLCNSNNPEASSTPACGLSTDTSINWENGWVIYVDDDHDGNIDTGESTIRQGSPLRSGYTLRSSTALAHILSYLSTGELSNPGTFVLCDSNDITHARAIILGTNGRIRLAERNSGGVPVYDSGTALTTASCSSP